MKRAPFPPWYDRYNPTKLLSLLDINNKRPAVYISSGNRTGGKTTAFNSLLVNRFLKHGEIFGLVYRYAKDSSDTVNRFFDSIQNLFFQDHNMTSKVQPYGCDIYIDGKLCGHGLPLNLADDIKKRSHLLQDTISVLFDEFQSDTNAYLEDEVTRCLSIMSSISRGRGLYYRYVPLYMISNQVSMLNPYYESMGIIDRVTPQAHYIKGDGWVFERFINEDAQNALETSPLFRAFAGSDYLSYASRGDYLQDNVSLIATPKGCKKYICTLYHKGRPFGVHYCKDIQAYYISLRADETNKQKYACTLDDITPDVPYAPPEVSTTMLTAVKQGAIRYKDLRCKQAIENLTRE